MRLITTDRDSLENITVAHFSRRERGRHDAPGDGVRGNAKLPSTAHRLCATIGVDANRFTRRARNNNDVARPGCASVHIDIGQ